jgi:hypothetical protein
VNPDNKAENTTNIYKDNRLMLATPIEMLSGAWNTADDKRISMVPDKPEIYL